MNYKLASVSSCLLALSGFSIIIQHLTRKWTKLYPVTHVRQITPTPKLFGSILSPPPVFLCSLSWGGGGIDPTFQQKRPIQAKDEGKILHKSGCDYLRIDVGKMALYARLQFDHIPNLKYPRCHPTQLFNPLIFWFNNLITNRLVVGISNLFLSY